MCRFSLGIWAAFSMRAIQFQCRGSNKALLKIVTMLFLRMNTHVSTPVIRLKNVSHINKLSVSRDRGCGDRLAY